MSTRTRVALGCGVAAPVVAFAAILLATVLSPTFTWAGSALSDLGAPGAETALLFNGGLVAASVLALPFLALVWAASDHDATRLGTVVLGAAVVSMGLVGVFPVGSPYHVPAALGFYALLTYALFVFGSGRVLAGAAREGLLWVWLAVLHVTYWVLWSFGIRPGPGLAIPETVGALVLAAWLAVTVNRLR